MSFCLIEFIKNSVNAGGLFTKNSLKETNYWEICRNEYSVLRCSLNFFKEKWQHRTKAILHIVFESKTVASCLDKGYHSPRDSFHCLLAQLAYNVTGFGDFVNGFDDRRNDL